ncbi:MAG: EAL domain-containing protein [Marinobacter sp.]|nr:EAL domain-containing protein [Marinobacter sp.]
MRRRDSGLISLKALLMLFTGALVLLLLVASLAISFQHFRNYLADQLSGHAQDAATAVGLSLSNAIDGRDPVAAGSLIDATFDSGRYLSIHYRDNQGAAIAQREVPLRDVRVPDWFVAWVNLPRSEGRAEVIRGWSRLGQVVVVSHPGQAYVDLWSITRNLVLGALMVGGLALVLLFLLLHRVLGPLRSLEEQAQAISRKNFRHRLQPPGTRELSRVVTAMNSMADDLGMLFEGQAKLVQHLRKQNNEDPLTGLASRRAFQLRLKAEIESRDATRSGVLLLLQLADFAGFNQRFGRDEADRLLGQVGAQLQAFVREHPHAFAARRAGSEFEVFLPGASMVDALHWAKALLQQVDGRYADSAPGCPVAVHGGLAELSVGLSAEDLEAACDSALRDAQQRGDSGCHCFESAHSIERPARWREQLAAAIAQRQWGFWLQPLLPTQSQQPLLRQVQSKLQVDGGWVPAAEFVPAAERFGLMPAFDLPMLADVLGLLQTHAGSELSVSFGSSSISDGAFRAAVEQLLVQHQPVAPRLWVSIAEHVVHHHRKDVGKLVKVLVRFRVRVIVDRFGVGGIPFSYLRNLPFHALRMDPSFVRDLEQHDDNHFYIESIIRIAHSRGILVFGSGIETEAEWQALLRLGVDGGMGYHLGRPLPLQDVTF